MAIAEEEPIFNAARQIGDPAERRRFIVQACSGNTTLRIRIQSLLNVHDDKTSFLQPSDGGRPILPSGVDAGGIIGPYKLVRQIGEGGMGLVYLAEQQEPIRRQVALKIVKSGIDSKHILARFEVERQALALMDHANIAKVLDAGQALPAHAGGSPRPYFVMELIDGAAITHFCDQHRMALRERLELFIPVCHAVQHAHQKGIIHRDLKPSNLLVSVRDGQPVPKIIDFGVAKAIGLKLTEQTLATAAGNLVGTLTYMSPEQAQPGQQDIDTRTDIYSLGVILYELLTGSTPLDRARWGEAAWFEILRKLREEVPPKPSDRLGDTEELPSVALSRSVEAKKLTGLVRGDLDWIVMKCLEKDRSRRYATANGLARDIQRFLDSEPVEAGPPSVAYRLRKFARKHRAALAMAATIVGLLIASVVTLAVMLATVNRERQAKEAALESEGHRRKQARAALDALTSEVIENWLIQQPRLSDEHRRFLEQALQSYEEFAADTGQHEDARAGVAQAYSRVGLIRSQLGQRQEAEAAWERSRDLYAGLVADFPETPVYREDLAQIYVHLGGLYRSTGRSSQAEAVLSHSLPILRQLVADFPDQPNYRRGLALNLDHLGMVYKNLGRARDAEEAYVQAAALLKPLATVPSQPDDGYRLSQVHHNLGVLLAGARRPREALEHHAQAVTNLEQLAPEFQVLPRYRDALAVSRNSLADHLRVAGRHSEAEEAFRQTLVERQRLVAEFPAVPVYRRGLAMTLNNLGILLKDTGRAREAEEFYGKALAVHKQLADDFPAVPDHQNEVAGAMVNLARLLLARQELSGARSLLEEAEPYHQAALKAGPRHPAYRNFYRLNRWRLAEALLGLKNHVAASTAVAEFLRYTTEPPRDAYTAASLLAECVRLATQDEHLPDPKRQELAASYGDSAMASLRKAVELKAKEVAQIKSDANLNPLRGRNDFQKLLAELGTLGAPGVETGANPS